MIASFGDLGGASVGSAATLLAAQRSVSRRKSSLTDVQDRSPTGTLRRCLGVDVVTNDGLAGDLLAIHGHVADLDANSIRTAHEGQSLSSSSPLFVSMRILLVQTILVSHRTPVCLSSAACVESGRPRAFSGRPEYLRWAASRGLYGGHSPG